jgi:hypothetical protein
MPRPQDTHEYDPAGGAALLRIGTVAGVGATTLDVDLPGASRIPAVAQLASFTATVGAKVAVLLGEDGPVAIGIVK